MISLKFLFLLAFLFSSLGATFLAQDPIFSQNYASPLYLNPALTGAAHAQRSTGQYRNQWSGLSGNFVSANIAYDQRIDAINSGIGFMIMGDWQGQGTIQNYSAQFFYSFHHQVHENFTLLYGANIGFNTKHIDWSKLTFGDMTDPRRGFIYQTGDIPRPNGRKYLDLSLGFAAYTKNIYFGFSAHHINTPNISLLNHGKSALPMRYSAHAGVNINIIQGDASDQLVLAPNIFYNYQQGFQQLLVGTYLRYKNVSIGSFYRNKDAIIGVLGYQFKGINLSYSYDYTISTLTNASLGSHEIALGIRMNSSEKKVPFPYF